MMRYLHEGKELAVVQPRGKSRWRREPWTVADAGYRPGARVSTGDKFTIPDDGQEIRDNNGNGS